MRRRTSRTLRATRVSAKSRITVRVAPPIGNLLVEATIYDAFLAQLQKEGGYLVTPEEKVKLQAGDVGMTSATAPAPRSRGPAGKIAELAGFTIPEGKRFLIVPETGIGKEFPFCSEKLSPVLSHL